MVEVTCCVAIQGRAITQIGKHLGVKGTSIVGPEYEDKESKGHL